MPPVATAKAYVAAICSGLAAALSASLPFVGDSGLSVAITVALAVLASYGFTYAVPNAPQAVQGVHRRTLDTVDDVVDKVLGPPADGAPNA